MPRHRHRFCQPPHLLSLLYPSFFSQQIFDAAGWMVGSCGVASSDRWRSRGRPHEVDFPASAYPCLNGQGFESPYLLLSILLGYCKNQQGGCLFVVLMLTLGFVVGMGNVSRIRIWLVCAYLSGQCI
ncbi:hypothetical protein Tsubulata_018000 [Turnera subulata]|uniref:Uncharacterized protein n=1 Tax=Turnera subulata TaxID=218843 RepID=A0A9Q0JDA5_9ROSI|nr:hypothetical protein Tsubulata_018000 [Turnera subulata]